MSDTTEVKILRRRLKLRDDLYGAMGAYFQDENMPDEALLEAIRTALKGARDDA
jgi:hypothetical protein